jgi:hypothetical protein
MDEDQRALWAISLGLSLRFDINPVIGFQPELLYTRKGARWESSDTWEDYWGESYSYSYSNVQTFDYIELPLLFRVTPVVGSRVTPNLCIGPAPAFLLSGRYSSRSQDTYGTYRDSGALDYLQEMDLGMVIGGGIDIRAGKGTVTGEIRYNLGLINVFKDCGDSSIKHRTLSLLVGYYF